ncbi:hypothetical protein DL89DRAFT_316446, partial [Linderina pennispora]
QRTACNRVPLCYHSHWAGTIGHHRAGRHLVALPFSLDFWQLRKLRFALNLACHVLLDRSQTHLSLQRIMPEAYAVQSRTGHASMLASGRPLRPSIGDAAAYVPRHSPSGWKRRARMPTIMRPSVKAQRLPIRCSSLYGGHYYATSAASVGTGALQSYRRFYGYAACFSGGFSLPKYMYAPHTTITAITAIADLHTQVGFSLHRLVCQVGTRIKSAIWHTATTNAIARGQHAHVMDVRATVSYKRREFRALVPFLTRKQNHGLPC